MLLWPVLLLPRTGAFPSSTYLPQEILATDYTFTAQSQDRPVNAWSWLRGTALFRFLSSAPQTSISPRLRSNLHAAQYGDELVVRFNISTLDERQAIAEACSSLFLDVWNFGQDRVDIRLSQSDFPSLIGLLPQSLHSSHQALIQAEDLRHLVATSAQSASAHAETSLAFKGPEKHRRGNVMFDEYRPMGVIVHWMDLMASLYPAHVSKISIGTTFEGRDIPALRVGHQSAPSSGKHQRPRKTIIVSGGSHAREWIGTSTVIFAAYHFMTLYRESPRYTDLINEFDWVFVPTINPDGYVYTWETDRLWRKNRQRTSLSFCNGIDLDRSFSYMWPDSDRDDWPCSESYAGEQAFQATEAQQLEQWVQKETANGTKLVGYLDLHSYSQQILFPYSFSCQELPPTLEDLQEVAEGIAKVMRQYRTYYNVLPACRGDLGSYSLQQGGNPMDWFYHDQRVRHVYQIKLPDTGNYGFLLPAEYIVPTGEAVLKALLYFGEVLAFGTYGAARRANISYDSDDTAAPESYGIDV